MTDRFQHTETIGYVRRVTSSLGRALIGLALVVGAVPLQFWNEGRAVAEHRALEEGAGAVVETTATPLDPSKEGSLVHVSALATPGQPLSDADFGVATDGIALMRRVEMYQWRESKETRREKQLGGSEKKTTTYSYERVWSDDRIDSGKFEHREQHENPAKFPFESRRFDAEPVRLGDLVLAPAIAREIEGRESVDVSLEQLPPNLAATFTVDEGRLVTSRDPDKPEIGDVRIAFEAVPRQVVSVVGLQRNGRIEPFTASNGREIALLEDGDVAAASMFQSAQNRASALTTLLRVAGLAAMWIGLGMALGWLATVFDVLPILGTLVQRGLSIVAFLIAVCLSAITIATAWLFYRPLIGVALLAVAIGALWLLKRRGRGEPPAPAAMPPPPPGALPSGTVATPPPPPP
jgi:hypothetical protein